jgi:NAD(P) transhydrogenase subunit alpha
MSGQLISMRIFLISAVMLVIACVFLEPRQATSSTNNAGPVVERATASALAAARTGTDVSEPAEHGLKTDYASMLFVFMLATFIGLGVIRRVSRLLYTPLMSLTNAISAIAVVGSLMVTGSDHPQSIRILGAVALFASMTNIVSGFLITERMLKMFKKEEPRQ